MVVTDEARVSGEAWVTDEARVSGEAYVAGRAYVSPRALSGWYLLPVTDPRGYFAYASWDGNDWIISSGCRNFSTVAQARAHWGEHYSGQRWLGDMYLRALDWLEAQPISPAEID